MNGWPTLFDRPRLFRDDLRKRLRPVLAFRLGLLGPTPSILPVQPQQRMQRPR